MALFKPGQSGNPSGRPKGLKGLSERLHKKSRGGMKYIEGLEAIVADPKASPSEKAAAYKLLLAYTVGKPESTLNMSASVTASQEPARTADLSILNPAELLEFQDVFAHASDLLENAEARKRGVSVEVIRGEHVSASRVQLGLPPSSTPWMVSDASLPPSAEIVDALPLPETERSTTDE